MLRTALALLSTLQIGARIKVLSSALSGRPYPQVRWVLVGWGH